MELLEESSKAFSACLVNVMTVKFSEYRVDDIQRKLNIIGVQPLDLLVTGVTGAGKSTTLNTILQRNEAKVGYGAEPETMDVSYHIINDFFRIWDSPGLGEGFLIDKKHKQKIADLLKKTYRKGYVNYGFVDMVLIIVNASSKNLGETYDLLDLVRHYILPERVLIAINQADFAMSGRHWDYHLNRPDSTLVKYLEDKAHDVRQRINECTRLTLPKPVYYSAEYSYNIDKLLDYIINNMPTEKRKMISV